MPSTADRIRTSLTAWYRSQGRAALPWRVTRDPYFTLVSEFMLQQTQVDRVVPKFEAFVARFPNFAALAAATTADVLRAWKGLGYNSRAVRLKQVAEAVCERFGGGRYPARDGAPARASGRRAVHGRGDPRLRLRHRRCARGHQYPADRPSALFRDRVATKGFAARAGRARDRARRTASGAAQSTRNSWR